MMTREGEGMSTTVGRKRPLLILTTASIRTPRKRKRRTLGKRLRTKNGRAGSLRRKGTRRGLRKKGVLRSRLSKQSRLPKTPKLRKNDPVIHQFIPTIPNLEDEKRLSFEDGYRHGRYEGGELILANLLPENTYLPDISVEDVITAGFEQFRHQLQSFIEPEAVCAELHQALEERRPMSLVRLGDGEMFALAHDKVVSTELVRRHGDFLAYAGLEIPDHNCREQLAEAVRKASFVGVPTFRSPNFHGLLLPVLRAHGIHMGDMRMTVSTVNYAIALQGHLYGLLKRRRVLTVGNAAVGLASVLRKRGITVTGTIAPVRGTTDIPRILDEVSRYEFDIALVAAGIPAVILAQQIAERYNKVAIDFGHLANKIADGVIAI